MRSVITCSEEETFDLGEKLGTLLMPGDFVALVGELGAGKTRFVQGIAAGLKVEADRPVTSPSYSILHIHNGRLPLYHFDLYRLRGDEDVEELGFKEYFYGEGVTVVEWADRLHSELPEERLLINFSHQSEEKRLLEFATKGKTYDNLVMKLFQ